MTTKRRSRAGRSVRLKVNRRDDFHFRQGMDLEFARAVVYLKRHTGIGSGAEAAAALERKEHRR